MVPASSASRTGAAGDPLPAEGPLAGLDPGRSKCGLVLSDPRRQRIRMALVLPPERAWQELLAWRRQQGLVAVVLGDGTGSAAWRERLEPLLPVCLVEERHSTLAARERFWQLERPRGWRRLLPAGLRQPPRDWDDVVAQLLLERYLGHGLERGETEGVLPVRTSPAP
jgi:RNase H-fold protein (predicted Holliday junction resolvase)